jgi:mRNA interferase RelE/StbE
MKIDYSKQAIKTISKMEKKTKTRIKLALERLPKGDVKPLIGAGNVYRLRVGDWRILFTQFGDNIFYIRKIAPRGDVYKEM